MLQYIVCLSVLLHQYAQATSPVRPIIAIPIKPICGPVCMIHCPFGNVLDKHGCPTCTCRPNPDIRPCPVYKCAVYCVDGYVKDRRGCTTCKCRHAPRPPLIGRCPRNSKSNISCPPMLSHDDCRVDKDCHGRKKCCTFGCSKKCINPKYSRPIWLH